MLISEVLKKLLCLLADGQFHSGTALASAVGVSRSAIWKHLQTLADVGIELIAVSGKGYKLSQPLQFLDRQHIDRYLRPDIHQFINRLEIHDCIDSTNNYLLEQARLGADSGCVCVAEYQSAGKGRRGRQWVSPFGQNIYLSILWRYQEGPAAIAGLSLALGVAVARTLKQLGVTEIGLKWPNDIFRQQRKLGGILVEVSGESSGPCHAVIGLGLNFYLTAQQADSIDQPWTDIVTALGENAYLRRNELVAYLLNQLLPLIAGYEAGSIQKYAAEWRSYDCLLDSVVDIYIGQQCFKGRLKGIDDDGLLLLETSDGHLRSFASGEVSFRSA
ncbi:bifunctional biotin--[acetyl-CoA-carboxylase] ligase/biotin operon repressor BirA [Methylomonas sp. AM2-LC]|uniref:bifunctional biotin--[acetyl-CoA-carboxylase] ligase/biotin operon repressor BirA n=1 Tax=Methylomonas sp. AM2-LC TaxID=3153301 RepID=UPI003263C4AD